MRLDISMRGRNEASSFGRRSALAVVTLVVIFATLAAVGSQDGKPEKEKKGKTGGFILSQDATAEDVGLPLYPGAQRLKDTPNETSAVQLGHSGGFKLVVLKLVSSDSPEKIAAFYRKALAKYGEVLDCSKPAPKHENTGGDQTNALDCEDDEPENGGIALKAGTKEKQHVVGVAPKGNHNEIALVYLESPK